MAHKGKATLWRSWSFTSAFLLVCLARLTQSYNLRKALGRNRENGHEGKILFGNFFEKGRTGLPTSIHANWNVTSSAEDAIGYQKDSSGWFQDDPSVQWKHMELSVQCGAYQMKLVAREPEASQLQLVQKNAKSLPLTQLPETCGYSISRNNVMLVMVASYDGCTMMQEDGRYILPMLWQRRHIMLSCPIKEMHPAPPIASRAIQDSPLYDTGAHAAADDTGAHAAADDTGAHAAADDTGAHAAADDTGAHAAADDTGAHAAADDTGAHAAADDTGAHAADDTGAHAAADYARADDTGALAAAEDTGALAAAEDTGALAAAEDTGALAAADDTGALAAADDTGALAAADDTGALAAADDTGALAAADDTGALVAADDTGALVAADDTGALVAAEDTGALVAAEDTRALVAAEDTGAHDDSSFTCFSRTCFSPAFS
ncbi:unnamed protein product [Gadus morhua 'NCC']